MIKNSIKFSGRARAWLKDIKSFTFSDLVDLLKEGKNEDAINAIQLCPYDMESCGWVEVGVAELTVTLLSADVIQSKQIEALQEVLRQHRVKAELYEQEILSRISKLQALDHST